MAIVTITSSKGGCGKTTLCAILASHFALNGVSVAVIDGDPNEQSSAFVEKAEINGLTTVREITEANIIRHIADQNARADIVFVDLAGGASAMALKAMQKSNAILVPTQKTLLDSAAASTTMNAVEEAVELSNRKIATSLIWTRVKFSIESRGQRLVRETIEKQGFPMFKSLVSELAVYENMHITGKAPIQVDPKSKATEEVRALAFELEKLLGVAA